MECVGKDLETMFTKLPSPSHCSSNSIISEVTQRPSGLCLYEEQATANRVQAVSPLKALKT